MLTEEKQKILSATDHCKKRAHLLKQIIDLETEQKEVFPYGDYRYLAALHLRQHPLIAVYLLYWLFSLSLFIYLSISPLKSLYNKFLTTQSFSELVPLLQSSIPTFKYTFLSVVITLLLFVSIVLIRKNIVQSKCRNVAKEYQQKSKAMTHTIREIRAQLDMLESFMSNPENCIIPPTYWNAFMKIEEYILNLRANTITEAINLYEMEKHYSNQEALSIRCPQCGSTNISTHTQVLSSGNGSLVLGILIFLFIPIVGWIIGIMILCTQSSSPRIYNYNVCGNCGQRVNL